MASLGSADRAGLRVRPIRRDKRWWRKFASPLWVLLGVPALIFPAALVVMMEDDGPRSAVEIAVSALPIAGDASAAPDGKTANPFGEQSGSVPVSTASSLFSRSAQVAAVHPGTRIETAPAETEVVDYKVLVFNALHPLNLASEDLLSSGANLQYLPTGEQFAKIVYREFCMGGMASQGAPGEFGKLGISNNLVVSLLNYMPLAEITRACPQLR